MVVADSFWSGAGAAVITGLVVAVSGVAGFCVEFWRNRRKEQKERLGRAEDLRTAARGVSEAFDSAAAALRIARASNGSLEGWADDDESLGANVDRIRRVANSDLWDEIQTVTYSLSLLRKEQRQDRAVPVEDCENFARTLRDAAKRLRAEYELIT